MSKSKFQNDIGILEVLEGSSKIESFDDSDSDPDYDPVFSGFSSDDKQQRDTAEAERQLESQLGAMAIESDEEFERLTESIVSTIKWTEFRGCKRILNSQVEKE